ncbi:MAG: class I SAM-dependent methyltransferase [Anaerolineales bacterium]
MSKFTDQQYLKTDQYRDSSNLDARVMIHQRFSTNSYGWFKWVFDTLLALPEKAKILELGCGPGYLWKENINRIPAAWNIILSDLSSGMLDAAWRNLVVTGRAFKFEEIDAQSIPYKDETFNAVIANHMLYHVPDRPKAIAEMKRVLKPSGRLIATTIGYGHLKELNEWLRRASAGKAAEPMPISFTLENGAKQLHACFSKVDILRYPDSLHVTEIEPLIAFFNASFFSTEITPEALREIHSELEIELKEKGSIFIAKDSGLFEAIK